MKLEKYKKCTSKEIGAIQLGPGIMLEAGIPGIIGAALKSSHTGIRDEVPSQSGSYHDVTLIDVFYG